MNDEDLALEMNQFQLDDGKDLINSLRETLEKAEKALEKEKEKAKKAVQALEKELAELKASKAGNDAEDKGMKILNFFLDYPAFKPFRLALLRLFNLDKNQVISRRAFSLTRYGIMPIRILRDFPEYLFQGKNWVSIEISD